MDITVPDDLYRCSQTNPKTKERAKIAHRHAELPLVNPLLVGEVERLRDLRGGEDIRLGGNRWKGADPSNPVSWRAIPGAELTNKLDEPAAATCAEPAGGAARGPRRAAAGVGGGEEERVEAAEAEGGGRAGEERGGRARERHWLGLAGDKP